MHCLMGASGFGVLFDVLYSLMCVCVFLMCLASFFDVIFDVHSFCHGFDVLFDVLGTVSVMPSRQVGTRGLS